MRLTRSEYYDGKFGGLVELFGEEGCRVVGVGEAGVALRIADALAATLDAADRLSPALLQAAQRQV